MDAALFVDRQGLVQVSRETLQRLLDLLELASRRGAFEIAEFLTIFEVHSRAKDSLEGRVDRRYDGERGGGER